MRRFGLLILLLGTFFLALLWVGSKIRPGIKSPSKNLLSLFSALSKNTPPDKVLTEQVAAISLPALKAEVFFLNAEEIVKRGPTRFIVIRFAGTPEFKPFNLRQLGLTQPLPIEEWGAKLKAQVIINAGQFDEHLEHLGLLKNGEWLSKNYRPAWKALLVTGPNSARLKWGGIMDLEQVELEQVTPHYHYIVQSMMLFHYQTHLPSREEEQNLQSTWQARVRSSELAACRTVLAEDKQGRLLIIITEGAVTLIDLAHFLPKSAFGLVKAMNLDGGLEAQLYINTPELQLAFYGQYGTEESFLEKQPAFTVKYPLPAVIAVE